MGEERNSHRPLIRYGTGDTSVGPILVALSEDGLRAVTFLCSKTVTACLDDLRRTIPRARIVKDEQGTERVLKQLGEVILGKRSTVDIPLDLRGTAFQMRV